MIPNGFYLSRDNLSLDVIMEKNGVKVATSGYSLKEAGTTLFQLLLVDCWTNNEYNKDYWHKCFLNYPVKKKYKLIAPEILIGWIE